MLSPLPRRSGWAYCFAQSPSRISLPRKGCRVGLRIVLFEACSAFTRVTACTLALSPIRDTHSEGFSYFVTSIAAPVASGWSGCRVGLTPTGKRRLSRRTPVADLSGEGNSDREILIDIISARQVRSVDGSLGGWGAVGTGGRKRRRRHTPAAPEIARSLSTNPGALAARQGDTMTPPEGPRLALHWRNDAITSQATRAGTHRRAPAARRVE